MALETEAATGNTTINYEAALTAVETPEVMVGAAAVDAEVAPDAGNSSSICGSGSRGVDVGSDETAVTMAMATGTVTAVMTMTTTVNDDDHSGNGGDRGKGKHRQQSVTTTAVATTRGTETAVVAVTTKTAAVAMAIVKALVFVLCALCTMPTLGKSVLPTMDRLLHPSQVRPL